MAQHLYPTRKLSNVQWTGFPLGLQDIIYAIDEPSADDTDYIQLAGPAAAQAIEFKISNGKQPADTTQPHLLRWRARSVNGVGLNEGIFADLFRFSDSQQITVNPAVIVSRTGFTDYSYTLTQDEVDLITDYEDLLMRLRGTCQAGEFIRISWAEVQVPSEATQPNDGAWLTKGWWRKKPSSRPLMLG